MNRTLMIDEARYPQLIEYIKNFDKRELNFSIIKLLEFYMVLEEKNLDLAVLTNLIAKYPIDNISLIMTINEAFGDGKTPKINSNLSDKPREKKKNPPLSPVIPEEKEEIIPEIKPVVKETEINQSDDEDALASYMPELPVSVDYTQKKPKKPAITDLNINFADMGN